MFELNICHLYPDLLNLYGDKGNVTALKMRAEWQGLNTTVMNVSIGDRFIPENYDIVFIGGGQDYEQEIIQDDFLNQKGAEIRNAIKNGKVFLAICGGYQMLGSYYRTGDGREIGFLGALDIWTIAGKERMIGNIAFKCDFLLSEDCDGVVIGFENHSGKTYMGTDIKPLGSVISGYGNNGEDHYEGAMFRNTFCTYSHGSLLPKNPHFADYLITLALKNKYKDFKSLKKLDDGLEQLAHDMVYKKIVSQMHF